MYPYRYGSGIYSFTMSLPSLANLPREACRRLVVFWVIEDVWVSSKVVVSGRANESFKRMMKNVTELTSLFRPKLEGVR
jgi:hypothetical protein